MSAVDLAGQFPGPLPEGETILWQGAPRPAAFARKVLHLKALIVYFGAMILVVAGSAWHDGRTPASVGAAILGIVAAGSVLVALVWGFAALVARTTRYTITNRRIVMRIGVALPLSLNLPFATVESAGLSIEPDGTGDLPISLSGDGRIAYLHLWPHARPWRLSRPQPMLRCVPEAAQVAAILARALGSGQLGQAAAARDDVSREETLRHGPAATRPSVAA